MVHCDQIYLILTKSNTMKYKRFLKKMVSDMKHHQSQLVNRLSLVLKVLSHRLVNTEGTSALIQIQGRFSHPTAMTLWLLGTWLLPILS